MQTKSNSARTHSIIPRPDQVSLGDGEFKLSLVTCIAAAVDLYNEAEYLALILRRSTGYPFPIREDLSNDDRPILIELTSEADFGEEGYALSVNAGGISIRAGRAQGAFYGIQTLLQLLPPAIFGAGPHPKDSPIIWAMPFVEIADSPRFSWRGVMLDCVRHFRSVDFVKKMIRVAAVHKLNTLHWHLTDDQGWRIEIKKYPRLTEVGAWRKETKQGHFMADGAGDGIPHGGFYTQEEIRDVVAYAAQHHITVVPEIEMPGHAQAAIAAYPELGCTQEKVEVLTKWGISEYIYNPEETTIMFLQDVLTEVLALFPGRFIHVGGDEALKPQWEASESVKRRMQEVGVKDVHELQSYFIQRMEKFLSSHGRRLIGWDEILEGGLAAGAAVMSWRGVDGGLKAANAGHSVVMTPQEYTYLDFYQSTDVLNEPLAIGNFLPLEKVYSYEPLPEGLSPEHTRFVLGTQAQLWGEFMPTADHVEYMAFPRLAAVAEVAWSSKNRNFEAFCNRLERHLKRLDILGVRYRPFRHMN